MLAHNALQCLTLLPGRHLTSLGVIDELIRLMNREGGPAHIRLETDPSSSPRPCASGSRGQRRHPLRGAQAPLKEPLEEWVCRFLHARLHDELLDVESFTDRREVPALLIDCLSHTHPKGRLEV